jgi:hypothetical protein
MHGNSLADEVPQSVFVRMEVQPHKYYWRCLTVHEIAVRSLNTSNRYVGSENISKLTKCLNKSITLGISVENIHSVEPSV